MNARKFVKHPEAEMGEVYLGDLEDSLARLNVLHLQGNGMPSIRLGKPVRRDNGVFYPIFVREAEALEYKKNHHNKFKTQGQSPHHTV